MKWCYLHAAVFQPLGFHREEISSTRTTVPCYYTTQHLITTSALFDLLFTAKPWKASANLLFYSTRDTIEN